MKAHLQGALLTFCLLAAGVCHAQAPVQPEPASGFVPKPAVNAAQAMIVTANPHATAAGLDVLRDGGSATDAAIAAVLVLNVVEPQSSGLGGGAFALSLDARSGRIVAWDGRETAPSGVDEALFLTSSGEEMPFFDAVVGGRSVGVPGLPRLLAEMHTRDGRLPWARLFEPAVRLAEEGFAISPRLHRLIAGDAHLRRDPAARALFFDAAGQPLAVGERLRNIALAVVLRELAASGAEAFYTGRIADDMVAAVRAQPNAGVLAREDLAAYRVVAREALCAPYRRWRVCGMPPPSSGGGTVLAILGMLQRFPLADLAPDSAFAVHLFAEAGRLAYADRDAWYGDPRTMRVSTADLLEQGYLADRAQKIALDASAGNVAPGRPAGEAAAHPQIEFERPATTHLSVVDPSGNAVALTASIENAFGSRRMVRGFLLNNHLTDFSFRPTDDRGPHPNRVGPGLRPRSSMAPTLVFSADGALHAVLGSPGGSQIINYVAATLVGLLDWNMAPDVVLARPHAGSRNGPTEVEQSEAGAALASHLQLFGHRTVLAELTSGIGLIVRTSDGWRGAADPRREGTAAGF